MSKTCPPSPASSRSSRTSPLGIPSVDAPWNVVRIDPGGVLTSLEIAPGRSYTIGRRATSDLVVDHDTVSREQALVVGRMSGLPPTLEDLGSRNGTRVGGRVLEPGERFELHHGSTIEIGLTTLLVHHGAVASESLGPASSVRSAPTHERHD